jgi:hypothetical protein
MNVVTNVTPEEYKQAIKLNRPKSYWGKLLLANWYSSVLLIVIVWAEIAAALSPKGIRLNTVPLVLIPVFFLWLSWYRTQKSIEKGAEQISDIKASARLEADGIHSTRSSGATSYVPWGDFSSWKEGPDVFTVSKGTTFMLFSKRGLGDAGEQEVRSLLSANVS